MSEKCETCKFWGDISMVHKTNKLGACRRQPPRIVLALNNSNSEFPQIGYWPLTSAVGWCGEWELRPEPAPQVVAKQARQSGGKK